MKHCCYFCRLKEKQIRRVTSEQKPALTDANNRARVEYCLRHLEPCSMRGDPTFRADMDVVHIDEKWFYRTRKTQNMYLSHREEAPHRECKNKATFRKLSSCPQWPDQGMMLKAIVFLMARLGFGLTQIGVCSCYYSYFLLNFYVHIIYFVSISIRLRGTWELKPCHTVDREKSREYLVKYALPAIKEKWPESDRWNTIYVQQDNARTHILLDDPVFM